MKRMLVLTMAGIMALSMTACGQQATTAVAETEVQEAEATQTEETQTEETQIANPWHDSTEEEANSVIPRLFKIPDGAENVEWMVCESGTDDYIPSDLYQATFDLDGLSYTARAQITGDNNEDISGLYYDWTLTDTGVFQGWQGMEYKVSYFVTDEYTINLINFYDVEVGNSYSLSTEIGKDADGFDITGIAECMFDETKIPGFFAPPEEDEYPTIDITGCDTFTQIVDKLDNGMGYANATMGDEDVLLVASGTFDGDGKPEAIDAQIFKYTDGVPTYVGFVQCGGTAYPLGTKDGMLYVGGNHFINKYTIAAGGLVIDEEAWVTYDSDGNGTYFNHSDLRGVGADENGQVADDSAMNKLYDEYMNSEIIEFNVISK